MDPRRLAAGLVLLACCTAVPRDAYATPPAAPPNAPATAEPHAWRPPTTKGWTVAAEVSHDLDGNGHPDHALVLQAPSPAESMDTPDRMLVVGLSDGTATTLALATECIAMCQTCGGVMGDPFTGMDVRGKRSLVVGNYGGSNHRWSASYTLLWRGGAMVVAGYDSSSFHTSTPDQVDTLSVNLLSGKYARNGGALQAHDLTAPKADDCAAIERLGNPDRR